MLGCCGVKLVLEKIGFFRHRASDSLDDEAVGSVGMVGSGYTSMVFLVIYEKANKLPGKAEGCTA
jgi:hypothetical protein